MLSVEGDIFMPNQLPSELNKLIAYSTENSLGNFFGGNMNRERWRWIKGFEGRYMISDWGRVKSYYHQLGKRKTPKYLKSFPMTNGYYIITLCKNSKHPSFLISRLVALHFIPNPENKEQVNHKDGVKMNNHYANLEWNTRSENMIHSYEILKNKAARGENNCKAKLNWDKVQEIRRLYKTRKYTHKQLGKMFKVVHSNIASIIKNKTWINI